MKKTRLIGIGLILVFAIAAAGCGGKSKESSSGEQMTLRIGYSLAKSGGYAPFDVPVLNGAEFAAQEINNAGGPVKVEIVSKDNRGDQTQSLTTVQELLDEGVNIQLLSSVEASTAMGQLVAKNGGMVTGGLNTAPALINDVGDRAVSIVFLDNQQSAALAAYACDQGYKTAYLIGSSEISYTKDTPDYFADAFEHDCGGTIVGRDNYKIGQTEFAQQVTKLSNVKPQPDVVFTPLFPPDTGVLLRAMKSAGLNIPYLSLDGNDAKLLVDSGGDAVDGMVYTAHGFNSPGSAMETFVNDYTTWKGKPPETNAIEAVGRDNVYMLVEAAKNAGSTDPDAVLKALLELKDVPLLAGNTTMNPDTRSPIQPVTLVKMEGTTFTLLKQVEPEYVPAAK